MGGSGPAARNGAGDPPHDAPADRSTRLHTAIARDLGIAIAAGRLRPGDTLSGEVASSARLAVSRTAYREAVRILAAKGLVESRTRTGTRVSPRPHWNILDAEVLGWFLQTWPAETFVRDLFELRLMVEPAAAALAAERRSEAQLRAMAAALDAMDRLKLSTEGGRAADRAFHHAILEATGNEAIVALSSSVCAAIRWTTLFKHRVQETPRDPMPEHLRVLEAIGAGEAASARAAMTDVVRFALDDMQACLAAGAAAPRAGPDDIETIQVERHKPSDG